MELDKNKLSALGFGETVNEATPDVVLPQVDAPVAEEIKVCDVVVNDERNNVDLAIPIESFDPLAYDSEELFNGVEARYPMLKFPSGKTPVFMVNDVPVSELTGTVIYHHRMNVYYKTAFEDRKPEDEKSPDCASMDGITGIEKATQNEISCADCPLNQFVDGHKACANKIRLYFCLDGQDVPHIIDVPPSSISEYQSFLNKFAMLKKNMFQFKITIKLTLAQSSGKIDYCKAAFSMGEEHGRDEALKFYAARQAIKDIVAS